MTRWQGDRLPFNKGVVWSMTKCHTFWRGVGEWAGSEGEWVEWVCVGGKILRMNEEGKGRFWVGYL